MTSRELAKRLGLPVRKVERLLESGEISGGWWRRGVWSVDDDLVRRWARRQLETLADLAGDAKSPAPGYRSPKRGADTPGRPGGRNR